MTQRLTPADPVSKDVLAQFKSLSDAKVDLAGKLMSLEQEKIRILASHRRIEDHMTRLFEMTLVERGISPEAEVEIDPQTGVLSLVTEGAAKVEPKATEQATPPADPKA